MKMTSDLLEYRRGRGATNTYRPLTHPHSRRLNGGAVMQPIDLPEEWRPIAHLLQRVEQDGDCLRWRGHHNHKGYGYISVEGETRSVHRYVYEIVIGPIPEGLEIDHVAARGCEHRDCINPDHLEAVTHTENVRRSNSQAGINFRKTHCSRGHILGGGNLIRRADGGRECRACRRVHRSVRVPCDECGLTLFRKNMSRHRRKAHGIEPPEADQ